MATSDLVEAFASISRGTPGIDPDVVETLVGLKTDVLGDPHPARWRAGDLWGLITQEAPEKVSAEEDWWQAIVPTMRAYLTWARDGGWLHRGSAPFAELLQELDDVADILRGETTGWWGGYLPLPAVRLAPGAELADAVRALKLDDSPVFQVADDDPDAAATLLERWSGVLRLAIDTGYADDPDTELEGDAQAADQLVADALDEALRHAYTGVPLTLSELAAGVQQIAEPPTIGPDAVTSLRAKADALMALGAVEVVESDDEPLELTPLGVYGLRQVALALGVDAPVVGDVTGLDAAGMVEVLTRTVPDAHEAMAQEWFAAQPSAQEAVRGLVEPLSALPPSARRVVVMGLGEGLPAQEFLDVVRSVRGEPVVGPVLLAYATLHVGTQTELETVESVLTASDEELRNTGAYMQGVFWLADGLTAAESAVVLVESVASVLGGSGADVRTEDLPPLLWELVEDGEVDAVAGSGHPQTLPVLDAIGSGHPKGRVRKAAKKAAHKLRTATS